MPNFIAQSFTVAMGVVTLKSSQLPKQNSFGIGASPHTRTSARTNNLLCIVGKSQVKVLQSRVSCISEKLCFIFHLLIPWTPKHIHVSCRGLLCIRSAKNEVVLVLQKTPGHTRATQSLFRHVQPNQSWFQFGCFFALSHFHWDRLVGVEQDGK